MKEIEKVIYFTMDSRKGEKSLASRQEWEREWLEWWKRVEANRKRQERELNS